MNLTAANVSSIFLDCLYNDEEIKDMDRETLTAKSTLVEGVAIRVGFNPEKLEKHKDDIKSMLSCLQDEFMQDKGGGFSFLNACYDKNGNQWTGLHKAMDELFMLGQGIKVVRPCLPRELWDAFPGGMPYYAISFEGFSCRG